MLVLLVFLLPALIVGAFVLFFEEGILVKSLVMKKMAFFLLGNIPIGRQLLLQDVVLRSSCLLVASLLDSLLLRE